MAFQHYEIAETHFLEAQEWLRMAGSLNAPADAITAATALATAHLRAAEFAAAWDEAFGGLLHGENH